ncbi:MAG: response regulator transcription factor [Campylobacterota bacterium]|nr:response regulator transcription factor [Campylobacterota bacterium]
MKKAKLLLLEDDISLSETLVEYLEEHDYDVHAVYDGVSAEDSLYEIAFDLLVLDVNVPEPNGFDLLKVARKNAIKTPAIFMTTRDSMEDLEQGYESGGDDYIRKPFALKELLLRIESMLKRNYFHHHSDLITISQGITYDRANAQLSIDGEIQSLAHKESQLLKLFIQHRKELLTHEVIMMHLWEYDETSSDTALRTYIKNLRKLLGKDQIFSHKRLGYQFR